MRVLVCGGRDFTDAGRVDHALSLLHAKRPISVLVHGAARGADTLADRWADRHGVERRPYPVTPLDWRTYGKRAARMRNVTMLREECPDLVVAFPGHNGTAHMVEVAEANSVPVWKPYR